MHWRDGQMEQVGDGTIVITNTPNEWNVAERGAERAGGSASTKTAPDSVGNPGGAQVTPSRGPSH